MLLDWAKREKTIIAEHAGWFARVGNAVTGGRPKCPQFLPDFSRCPQELWRRATQKARLFDEDGQAAHWSATSKTNAEKAYAVLLEVRTLDTLAAFLFWGFHLNPPPKWVRQTN